MYFDYGVPEYSVTISVFHMGSQCANYQKYFLVLKFTQKCFRFFLKVNTIYRQTLANNKWRIVP
jgi:hypothetical protein